MEKTEREIKFPDFPKIEYEQRIKRAKVLMEENNIDALVLFNQQNIRYYTGFEKTNYANDTSWRRSVIIPREGYTVAIVPQILYGNFRVSTWAEDIRPFGGPKYLGYPKDHHQVLIGVINELELGNKNIATELDSTMMPDLTFREFEAIKKDLPHANIVDASTIIWEQREIKSDYEIRVFRELTGKAMRSFSRAVKSLKEGMTEKDFHALLTKAYLEEGFHSITYGSHSYIGGPGKRDVHMLSYTNTVLRKGDVITFGGGPIWKGYFNDFMRNISIGDPPNTMKRFYEKILKSHEAAIDAIRPGIKASEIYQAAENNRKGFDMVIKFIGHGIGLQNHEPPYIDPESEHELRTNMIISVEVGGYHEGKKLWPADMILVTKRGYDVLTGSLSRELWVAK